MNEVLKAIRERRSVRRYKPEQITDAELNAILEAGTWAATGGGRQAATMVVLQDPETIGHFSRLNAQIWGTPNNPDPFFGAPTVVVVLANSVSHNWLKDGSLVMGNLMLAAHTLGLGSCWVNRCDKTFDLPEGKAYLEKWGLPDTYRGVGFCIIGYPDGPLPAPKPRKKDYILWPERT